ncbi:DivIVA domain-containing protein [Carbonactinospora thermoautotrophica]|uniref:DivIVA domain-containing protein n=1 Tax=Carbonactinospora thermoautotrophica TaxID=1469144 RepID=UPI001E347495|nr:DivIVA domain-containing protein [Carbonactinospora thermoautotrophica]
MDPEPEENRGVFWLELLIVAAVVFGVAVLATGRGGGMAEAYPDRPEPTLPEDRPLTEADVAELRFTGALRGYRMDQVDAVLDRLGHELAQRDARIAELEAALGGQPDPAPAQPGEQPRQPHRIGPEQPHA